VWGTFAGRYFHHEETVTLLVFGSNRAYCPKGKRSIYSAVCHLTNPFGSASYRDRIQFFRPAHVILVNTVDKDATLSIAHSAQIFSEIVILSRHG
jgi:hypothetical protein